MSITLGQVSVATWNVEWAKPGSKALETMQSRLAEHQPDIICFTECYIQGAPTGGHMIAAGDDWGYTSDQNRRKVMLWSKSPWLQVDPFGATSMPEGRFVSGVTDTPIGPLKVIGVCIPWRDAHVRTGRRDRQPWQDHIAYLDGLRQVLMNTTERTVLLGDFNQRIPRRRSPEDVYQAMLGALNERVSVVSDGKIQPANAQSIDHIAVTEGINTHALSTLSNLSDDGRQLSDHFGVVASLS